MRLLILIDYERGGAGLMTVWGSENGAFDEPAAKEWSPPAAQEIPASAMAAFLAMMRVRADAG